MVHVCTNYTYKHLNFCWRSHFTRFLLREMNNILPKFVCASGIRSFYIPHIINKIISHITLANDVVSSCVLRVAAVLLHFQVIWKRSCDVMPEKIKRAAALESDGLGTNLGQSTQTHNLQEIYNQFVVLCFHVCGTQLAWRGKPKSNVGLFPGNPTTFFLLLPCW